MEMRRALIGVWLVCLVCVGCEVHRGPMVPAGEGAGAGQKGGEVAGEVWVYTSMYQSVVEELDVLVRKRVPGVDVKWYRAGSEVVARRLETEWKAGGSQADLVMTSDPFWYAKLKEEGRLLPYATPDVLPLDRSYVDDDGMYATARVSTMVLVYDPEGLDGQDPPKTFRELSEERWASKVTLGDPLKSGTQFTTVAFLSNRYGWDFYKALHAGGTIASGGNSSVMRRVEGGEYAVGVVLLENVLTALEKGSRIRWTLPEDGAVTIPGPVAILSKSDNIPATKAVYDVVMSPEGQEAMVRGRMHSANPRLAPPKGTPEFEKVASGGFRWTPEIIEKVSKDSKEIKSTFERVMSGQGGE